MPKSTIDPDTQSKIENAVETTVNVIYSKTASLILQELKKNETDLLKEGQKDFSPSTRTSFTNFVKQVISEQKQHILKEVTKDPLFQKILNKVARNVGVEFSRKENFGSFIGIFSQCSSPDDMVTFFQILAINDTHILVDNLNANFTEETLNKVFS